MRRRHVTTGVVLVFGLLGVSPVLGPGATASTTASKAVLTVSLVGRGKITSKPRGISCPRRCRARFASGTKIQLVPHAARGWKLSRWAGACAGKRGCALTLDRSKTVRAIFRRRRRPSPPPPPPPPAPPPLVGTGGLHSTAGINVVGAPVGVAVGFGSFWVRTGSGTDIYRIDAATNTISADIQGLRTAPSGYGQEIAAGEGAIWTSNIFAGSVSRIDPATNRVVATIPVWPTNACGPGPSTTCSAPVGIATTPGAVWVALHHEWAVVRIDPATNTVVATIPVGSGLPESGPESLAAGNGVVYVGGGGGLGSERFLKRIDPATNAVTTVIELPTGCDGKAAAGVHVWIGVDGCGPGESGSVADVDTGSGSIVGQVALGGTPIGVAIGSGSVWAVSGSRELVRIDPTAHTVTGRLPFPAEFARVAVGPEGIWLAIQNAVYRIGE